MAKLSQCAWPPARRPTARREGTEPIFDSSRTHDDAKSGAAIAVQSFGDLKNFNSHLHVICTDGCFFGNDSFKACPKPNPKDLEDLFRYEAFNTLKSEGKSNDVVIENIMNWRHSEFKSQLALSAIYLHS